MAKQNLTLDYILGLNNGNLSHIDANNIDANNIDTNNANNLNNLNNLNKLKNKTKNNKNNNDKTFQNNTNDLNNNIDNILNKGLVKFENKIQTSMYFVCYKAINSFCLLIGRVLPHSRNKLIYEINVIVLFVHVF